MTAVIITACVAVSLGFLFGIAWSNIRFTKSTEELLSDFRQNAWNRAREIDPNNDRDWNDLACGYFLAKSVPIEQATDCALLCAATSKIEPTVRWQNYRYRA